MPKRADDYTIFEKNVHNKKQWYVYYRDEDGNRLSELSLTVLKKMTYSGRNRFEPIKDRAEAIRVAERALHNSETKDKIFNRKEVSPLFKDYVNKIWDYDNSPYIKGKLKEGGTLLRHTAKSNIDAFNRHIVPILPKNLTLKDIDASNGKIITKIRDKVIDLDIAPTTKNKAFQSMRTALEYAYQRNALKDNYKGKLKNTKVEADGTDPFTIKEVNKIISYYNKNTPKGTYERYPYLLTALSATTAMRPNEVMALSKSEVIKIDKKNDCAILKIDSAINTDGIADKRKNKKAVYVATYIPLIEEILSFSKANPKKENYCFWDRNHYENHITKDYFKNIPFDCFNEIGIKSNGRNLSFYSFRKSLATILANLNNDSEASEQLGHSDTEVTKKHYICSTEEGAINRFNKIRQLVKLSA